MKNHHSYRHIRCRQIHWFHHFRGWNFHLNKITISQGIIVTITHNSHQVNRLWCHNRDMALLISNNNNNNTFQFLCRLSMDSSPKSSSEVILINKRNILHNYQHSSIDRIQYLERHSLFNLQQTTIAPIAILTTIIITIISWNSDEK